MTKTILITGATDGIGLETAKKLSALGHDLLLHGRNAQKLESVAALGQTFRADMSDVAEVDELANAVSVARGQIDVLINNAGVLKTAQTRTASGHDVRFVVNLFAPVLLTRALLPRIPGSGRVVNLSSAAQAAVDLRALEGQGALSDMEAYAQSKLALTMWTKSFADAHPNGPVALAINPGSLLASKMVREGFGVAGNDLGIGADILVAAATEDRFAGRSGDYFDNDAGDFGPAHADTYDAAKREALVAALDAIL